MKDISKKILNIIFVSGEEVSVDKIAEALDTDKKVILDELQEIENRIHEIGLRMIKKGNHLMLSSHEDHHDVVKQFSKKETDSELSPAALQTLTIITYMPGATAQEISFIRGIESSKSIRNLMTRGLIEKGNSGYDLTFESLKHLGVTKSEQLPEFESINKNLKEKLKEALND